MQERHAFLLLKYFLLARCGDLSPPQPCPCCPPYPCCPSLPCWLGWPGGWCLYTSPSRYPLLPRPLPPLPPFLVRLPTPLRRIFSMAITNSCATGREMPRTKNQSKYIHGNLPGDRVYGQTARHSKFRKANSPNYQILYFELSTAFVLNIRAWTQTIDL